MLALLACFAGAGAADGPAVIVSYAVQGKFEDVRDDLKLAIEGRGLVVDYHSHVNRMLERTGKDIGATRRIYAGAEAFVFCSALQSRKAMEADAANVALCPYSIAVYALASAPGKVYVAYRRMSRADDAPASREALAGVDRLLDAIAREAAGLSR